MASVPISSVDTTNAPTTVAQKTLATRHSRLSTKSMASANSGNLMTAHMPQTRPALARNPRSHKSNPPARPRSAKWELFPSRRLYINGPFTRNSATSSGATFGRGESHFNTATAPTEAAMPSPSQSHPARQGSGMASNGARIQNRTGGLPIRGIIVLEKVSGPWAAARAPRWYV